jgi:acyl-[acyl carrier protein]--UDP-N-acetylglucosamine O-acyltransferase
MSLKSIARKVYRKFFPLPEQIKRRISNPVLYKLGNVKYHNSEIDGLIPQMVEIGDDFISAPGSLILAHDASLYNHIRKHRVEKTVIGNKVFLGAHSIILAGVKVGDGAIIGAGAIVTKDVGPYTVVAGNPARYICNVEEYIQKCESRNVLFDTPKNFEKIFEGEKYSNDDKELFQEYYMKSSLNKTDGKR